MQKQKQAGLVTGEQIDEWLKEGRKPEDVDGLLKQFTKAVLERALAGEMTEFLGYAPNDPAGNNSGNSRNGVTAKTLKGDFGELELNTPRDRNGEFEPRMVRKNQTRWTGFDGQAHNLQCRIRLLCLCNRCVAAFHAGHGSCFRSEEKKGEKCQLPGNIAGADSEFLTLGFGRIFENLKTVDGPVELAFVFGQRQMEVALCLPKYGLAQARNRRDISRCFIVPF